MTAVAARLTAHRLAAVPGPFREIGDLKRVRVAHADGSAAQRAFVRSWAALVAGEEPERVAAAECAAALAGARLGGIDAAVLRSCGLAPRQAEIVLGHAIDEVAGGLNAKTVTRVRTALPDLVEAPVPKRSPLPAFVGALCRQPRAGATAPGRPRLIVEPPENHAEHCWAVAVYGGLLADDVGAEPGDAFLLGLAHHLHNAVLPDAGFAGEMLLGPHLEPAMQRLTEREVSTLPAELADRVRELLGHRADAATPVGKAFHAADVLDRVLQCHHHARAAGFTADQALVDLELVHAGPVADYHHAVLAAAGL